MYVSAKLTSWKARQYQFNRMVFFSPRVHTKGEHVLAFQKCTFKYSGTVYTMWKMKKHQKKKKPQNDQTKEILASIKAISEDPICFVWNTSSVSVQEFYFPLSGYIFVIITILTWIMVSQRQKIWGRTAISSVGYYSQKQYSGVLEKIYI